MPPVEKMTKSDKIHMDSLSVEFMLKEFDNAFAEWHRLKEEGRKRVQFLFSIISVFAGGATYLFQVQKILPEHIGIIILVMFSLSSLLNWQTFNYLILRAINTDLNIRVMARVRRYFIEMNPDLLEHLSWQTDDGPTHFLDNAADGLLQVSRILLSVNIATVTGAVFFLIVGTDLNLLIAVFIGSFFISSSLLKMQIKRRLEKAKEKAKADQRFSPIERKGFSQQAG